MITNGRFSISLEASMANDNTNNLKLSNVCDLYISISWLKTLLELNLISDKEFHRMVEMTGKHYGIDIRC